MDRPTVTPLQLVLLWLKRLAIACVVLAALAVLALMLLVRKVEAELPSTRDLGHDYHPPQVTRVLARDGSLLAEMFTERRTVVSIAAIPPAAKLAILAAEDASFYEHEGLNYLGMLRALAKNVVSGRTRQGGSTITQQVVKNTLVGAERTYARKLREVILARRIEQELEKDQILELYLNHIYLGHGRYGIEEASKYYFGKSVSDVGLAEAALLAALPKGPEIYSPRHDLARATERRAFVLDQMVAKGFVTPADAERAKAEPIALAPELDTAPQLAPETVDAVRRLLRQVAGDSAERGGFTVHTTIDPAIQAAARAAVRQNLGEYDKRHRLVAPLELPTGKKKAAKAPEPFEGTPRFEDHRVYEGVVTGADDAKGVLLVRVGSLEGEVRLASHSRYNPKALPPSQFAENGRTLRVSILAQEVVGSRKAALRLELGPESALVALDVRKREILALVGNYEAAAGALDRASFAHRQPGSTFKPIVYSYALHARHITPATLVDTSPSNAAGYKPKNYEASQSKGAVRVREALAQSINVAAVHVMERAGPANVIGWARELGIESEMRPDLSLALGSYEMTPMEMVGAFSVWPAGGTYDRPILVTRIVGPSGGDIPLPPRPASRRVMDEAEAYLMTSMLRSVVESGTGKRAKAVGRPVAGKTGTSNDAKDAWFVGFSTDIACAVWTGFDDARPLGPGEAGSATALPAFVAFMKEAHRKMPVTDFPVPMGLVRMSIDPATGLRAQPDQSDAVEELFLPGTEPTEMAPLDAGAAPVAETGALPDGGSGNDVPGATESTGTAAIAPAIETPPQDPESMPANTPGDTAVDASGAR